MAKKHGKKPSSLQNGDGIPENEDNTVELLMKRARSALEEDFDYVQAVKWASKALEKKKDNVDAIEFIGIVYAEFGHPEQAIQHLQQCVALSPNVGPTKYLYLAQLSDGEKSLYYYKQSVECLLEGLKTAETPSEIHASLGSAYVSMAELYMTDLCELPEAENECESCLLLAKQYAPESDEVYQCIANLRLSQERCDDALEAVNHSLSLWWPKKKAIQSMNELPSEESLVWLPPFASRVQTVKLLLELSQYGEAEEILEDLLSTEDQEHPVLWYLLGFSAYIQEDFPASHSALVEASKYYRRRMKLNKQEDIEEDGVDDGLEVAISSLLKDIESKPKELWCENVEDTDPMLE